jgi:cytochrome P450
MAVPAHPTALQSPPSVRGLPFVGSAPAFFSAHGIPAEFLSRARSEHGDVVRFTVMGQAFYLISKPELIREVLLERLEDFHKLDSGDQKVRGLSRFLGHGILTADHEAWRPQRKLIQPLMHAKHIEQYAGTMATMGGRLLCEWEDGTERDIHADMTQVTMWIIADTMFGIDVAQTTQLEDMGNTAQQIVIDDLVSPLPAWLSRRDAEAARINDALTGLVRRFVAERRAQGDAERHDLLSLLLDMKDEDGNPVSDEFLRDNILTMFFAGHETTANTLTWAFYYLSQSPAVLRELQREVDTVLGNERLPTLDDLPNLPYTLMVIKETMRIQPTVAIIPRAIPHDTELGGYQLQAGSVAVLSPYVMHHDPSVWANPDTFDPTRFSAENEPHIPKYVYMPFGGGPRICIGNHFALMEAQILLALLASRYELLLAPDARVEPLRQVTTSPRFGMPMRLARRS